MKLVKGLALVACGLPLGWSAFNLWQDQSEVGALMMMVLVLAGILLAAAPDWTGIVALGLIIWFAWTARQADNVVDQLTLVAAIMGAAYLCASGVTRLMPTSKG